MFDQFQLIDLTQTLYNGMPEWQQETNFFHRVYQTYHQGPHITHLQMLAGTGTHVDAPRHFFPDKQSIVELTLEQLWRPAVVIDIRKQAADNPDYALSIADLKAWETRYKTIPQGALVLANTGWSQYWSDPVLYCHCDIDGCMHFPGFSTDAAHYLLERNVAGLGIDTLSLDIGKDNTFPVHHLMLGADRFLVENLCQLDKLPPHGAQILVCPLKIQAAAEAPARVIAFTIPAGE